MMLNQRIVLLEGRAIAVLVNDRCAPFYLISVYLHPDQVQNELEQIITSWRNVEKGSDKVVIRGDFNQADVKCPEVWKKFMMLFSAVDVHPMLATYLFTGGSSALDRFLVPEDWVSTARWNPEVRTLNSSLINGHKIIKVNVRVRPTVLNNPNDCLHETIPTEAFMPGKNGRIPKDNRALQSLVRLLHRTRKCLFDNTVPTDGFRLGDSATDLSPVGTYRLPGFNANDVPNQLLPHSKQELAARELHSTRDEHAGSIPPEVPRVNNDIDQPLEHGYGSHGLDCEAESHGAVSLYSSDPGLEERDADLRISAQLSPIGNSHLSISACFWSWWRSLPPEVNPAYNRPFLKARKFVHLPAQWVNVPRRVVEDLIFQSQGAILGSLDGLIISMQWFRFSASCNYSGYV